MDNNNYLISIRINEGLNLILNDECDHESHESQTGMTATICGECILEARFNDDVIRSDSIDISSNQQLVELRTELAFELDRKSLHILRMERKPIKLQCFVRYSHQTEQTFIGYTVLDLRNAQNNNRNKYEWKTLLNPKYKGFSQNRPQISIALTINEIKRNDKCVDQAIDEQTNHKLNCDNMALNLENDINVMLKNNYYHIWDSKHNNFSDCKIDFELSITIAFAENISKLLIDQTNQKRFHFRYTYLGTTIKTEPFSDINLCNFNIEKTSFLMRTPDEHTLRVYLELHPTIEIQFCDQFDTLYGFVAISLIQLTNQQFLNFNPIEGSFMLLGEDESLEICEPFPIIGVSIQLKKQSKTIRSNNIDNSLTISNNSNQLNENSLELNEPKLNHYCFAIDLRNIRLIHEYLDNIDSCYLEFSYAFFGFSESIKTFPNVKLIYNTDVVIPHGFCAFNFATTHDQLEQTFKNIPLIIEVIEQTSINTLIGISKVDLYKTLSCESNDAKQVINTIVPVVDEENKEMAQIQVIMLLQNFGCVRLPIMNNCADISVFKSMSLTNDSIKNIDDLLLSTAMEVELWKEKQLLLFREKLKQNETDYMKSIETKQNQRESEVRKKISDLTELENKLKISINDLDVREKNVEIKEQDVDKKQIEINKRYQKINEEISDVISDIKSHYEEKLSNEKMKLKEIERDKAKYQERVYFLERKVKDKDSKIKELEQQIIELRNKSINNSNNIKALQANKERRLSTCKEQTVNSSITSTKIVTREPQSSKTGNIQNIDDNCKTQQSLNSRTLNSSKATKSTIFTNTKRSTNNIVNNVKKVQKEEKIALIEKLKNDRTDLIAKGVLPNDDIIIEIDQHLSKIVLH